MMEFYEEAGSLNRDAEVLQQISDELHEFLQQIRDELREKRERQRPMQELLGLPGPIYFNDTLPVRQLTLYIGGEGFSDRYQLRRRTRARWRAEYGFTRIYEVIKLGHRDFPVRVGWLAWRPRPEDTGPGSGILMGWFYISTRHESWVSAPVRDLGHSVYAQDLSDGLHAIVDDQLKSVADLH